MNYKQILTTKIDLNICNVTFIYNLLEKLDLEKNRKNCERPIRLNPMIYNNI